MALTGQAKTDYQREYMRKRRSNKKPVDVRPSQETVRPNYYHQPHCNAPRFTKPFSKGVCCSCRPVVVEQPKQQSYNPMMVGYVPPQT